MCNIFSQQRVWRLVALSIFSVASFATIQAAKAETPWDHLLYTYTGHGDIWMHHEFVSVGRDYLVVDALSRIRDNALPFYLYNSAYIDAYTEMVRYVRRIRPLDEPGVYGRSDRQGTIFLSTPVFNVGSPSAIMVTMVHEADHSRAGMHTCGDGADIDDNGSYGVDAYYSIRLHHGAMGMDGSMRYFASSNALNIAYGNLCNNLAARERVLNAYYNNVFAPTPPPPPPRRGGGCSSGGVRYAC